MYKKYIQIYIATISIGICSQIELNGKTEVNYYHINNTQLNIDVYIGDLLTETINVKGNEYSKLILSDGHMSTEVGEPELPQIHNLIEIPQNCIPRIEIHNTVFSEFELRDINLYNSIFPSQPSLSKSEDPLLVPFNKNTNVYSIKNYLNRKIVDINIIGQMRDIRLANLIIRPVDYNPSEEVIKVFEEISFSLHFDNADFSKTDEIKQKYNSPIFSPVYNMLDYKIENEIRDDLINYPITYVIIANEIFRGHLDEFINWKIKKGFHVEVGFTDEVGSNTTALKNYIQQLYNNPAIGVSPPSFVLMVGDVAQLPTFSGNTGNHPTDLYYCEFTNDYLPEIYYGRFSAETPNQLLSQINKTLEYEKFEMPDPSFLSEVVMIAGVDGNYASTYGNGQINYGTEYYFNETNDIYSHTYLYPTSNQNWVDSQIREDVSNGAGFVNYTAHGYEGGWADPSFTVNDINNLSNDSKYPLMVGNCCITNQFESGTCFGEALLRATNKGAQGYIGGSNNTYWNEDYWWGVGSGSINANPTYIQTGPGAYDGIFHSYGQNFDQWYTCNSAIMLAGNLAVEQANGWSSYYWEIYHLMGDPSLTTYFGIPEPNNVTHLPFLNIGSESFEISADPYSYVAISKNGILHGAGLIDQDGTINLDINPFDMPGSADIVITRQNREPYISSIEIGNPDGPYIILNQVSFNNNPNNEIIFSSNSQISITIENIGNENLQNLTVELATSDPYIEIINGFSNVGDVVIGNSLYLENIFEIYASGQAPNGHEFDIEFNIQSNSDIWSYSIEGNILSPSISIQETTILGNLNGQINPGETASINLSVLNDGSAGINYPVVELLSDDPFIIIENTSSDNAYYLDSGETMNVTFNISSSENTPEGYIYNGQLLITMLNDESGFYSSAPFSIVIGTPPVINLNIEILTDDYGYETSWAVHDESGNEVTGFYDGNLENGTIYNWIVELQYGNYIFTIYDSYGDGICCGYGQGNYNLYLGTELISSGGEFGSEEIVEFTVGPGSDGDSMNPPQNLELSISGSACEAIMISWDAPDEIGPVTDDDTDGGDDPDTGESCDSCGEDSCIYDCQMQCVSEITATSWIGDGYCDDGTWGMYLNCDYFNNDDGDCDGDSIHDYSKEFYLIQTDRDLNGYNIYKNNTLLTFTSSTQYADGAIDLGNEYCYFITAVYTSGESNPTPEICIIAQPETALGDVNFDGTVNVVDIIVVINFILEFGIPTSSEFFASDLNGDNVINVLDIINIVNIIMEPIFRLNKIENIQIFKSSSYLHIKADQPIAGFEFTYTGVIEIDKSSLNEDWILEWNSKKLIGVNFLQTQQKEIKLNISGDYKITENLIGDWNEISYSTEIIDVPDEFSLDVPYPNPFNPSTTISYSIPKESNVYLAIYDLKGSKIESLLDNKIILPGLYTMTWTPNNLPSGLYFIHFISNDFSKTQKTLFIK